MKKTKKREANGKIIINRKLFKNQSYQIFLETHFLFKKKVNIFVKKNEGKSEK